MFCFLGVFFLVFVCLFVFGMLVFLESICSLGQNSFDQFLSNCLLGFCDKTYEGTKCIWPEIIESLPGINDRHISCLFNKSRFG